MQCLLHPRKRQTLTSRAPHAHSTSPRSTGFCAIWDCISSSSSSNTGPGFNRGFWGGARGCSFEERAGAYARTEGGSFPIAHDLCLCVSLSLCPHLLKRVFAFSDLKWREHACRRTSTTTAAAAATSTTTTFSSDAQGWSRAKNAAQIEAAAATSTNFSSTRKAGQHRRRTTIIIPPEATNTVPVLTGGGGARGCGFEEWAGAYARTERGHIL